MPELVDLAGAVASRAQPGEEIEAYVSVGTETSIRAFGGDVEKLASAQSAGVGVRVIAEGRQGFSWVGALSEAAASEALAEARDNAVCGSPDEHCGLARPDGVSAVNLDLWSEALSSFSNDSKAALAIELEKQVRASDGRVRQVVSSDYADVAVEWAVANSLGLTGSCRRTSCHLFVYAIAGDGDESQTGFGYSVGRSPDELDLKACAGDAARRATRMLGARKPKSAQVTAVFDRRVTATFLSVLARALSGEEVAKARSLFTNRVGEAVAHPQVTLVDDPTDARAPGASPSDAEGLATRRNELIEGGKLMGFLHDSHSARSVGAASTGSAVRGGYRTTPRAGARAIRLEPGELDQEAILAEVGEGLFVQSISGVNSGVNPVSGDFSVGAEGLLIRGGELAEPVREMTVASSLQRMLQHISHLGADLEWTPGAAAGLTLAIDGVSLGGT